jgi:hypothetical protein
MGDPIIIWLPGTVFDYNGACQQETQNSYAYACHVEDDGMGDGGVYVDCCIAGG